MVVAGIAWGVLSLRGRGVASPLAANARNFVLSVPLRADPERRELPIRHGRRPRAAAGDRLGRRHLRARLRDLVHRALRGLAATRAAAVQLSVPVIAAAGAVAFLGETATRVWWPAAPRSWAGSR